MTQISEIDALKKVDEALSAIDDAARLRVLGWANAKFIGNSAPPAMPVTPPAITPTTQTPKAKKAKGSSGKKLKTILKQDKDLNLAPTGKKSAADFIAEKAPTTVKEKVVVAVYYLLNVLELPAATVEQVYTIFKQIGWETPSDLRNTLQQAGTAGWLDTSVATDLKVTSSGENLIEHKLPKPAKKGSK